MMVSFEPPFFFFFGYQVSDPSTVNNWSFAINQYFDQMSVSNEFEKVHLPRIYLAGIVLGIVTIVQNYCSWHCSPITWTKIISNFRTIYAPNGSQQYFHGQ